MDPESLAFYGMVGLFLLVGMREIRKLVTDNNKLTALARREQQKSKRWEGMFESLPMAIEQTEAMLFEMKSKVPPPTPEQLEPVEKRLHQLHQVQANQWWIEIALKLLGPAADRVIKWVV